MDNTSNDFNSIREWLVPILTQKGISNEQLANDAGLSRASVYFYLSDRARPSEQSMIKICQVLGVPPEEGMRQYTPKKRGRPVGYRKPIAS
jgi:transcriptional regulator with XRE-family HTH domain